MLSVLAGAAKRREAARRGRACRAGGPRLEAVGPVSRPGRCAGTRGAAGAVGVDAERELGAKKLVGRFGQFAVINTEGPTSTAQPFDHHLDRPDVNAITRRASVRPLTTSSRADAWRRLLLDVAELVDAATLAADLGHTLVVYEYRANSALYCFAGPKLAPALRSSACPRRAHPATARPPSANSTSAGLSPPSSLVGGGPRSATLHGEPGRMILPCAPRSATGPPGA